MGSRALAFAISFSLLLIAASGAAYAGPSAFHSSPFLLSILNGIASAISGLIRAIASALGVGPSQSQFVTVVPTTSAVPTTVSTVITTILTTVTTIPPQECGMATTVYVGGSVNCTSVMATLKGVYTLPPVSNTTTFRYQAEVGIYYNGTLLNSTLLFQGSTERRNVSNYTVSVNVGQVSDGGTYLGQYAVLNVSVRKAPPPSQTTLLSTTTISTTLSTTTINYTCGGGVNHCFYGTCAPGYTCESGVPGVGGYCPEHIGYACVQT